MGEAKGVDRRFVRGVALNRRGRVGLALAWATALAAAGCKTPVSDLDAYAVVPMNKAVPYPSDEERAKRVDEVAVVDRPAKDLDEGKLVKARGQLRVGLEKIAASYGAAMVERSKPGFEGLRTDEAGTDFGGLEAEVIPSNDYTVSARITAHRHAATWTRPTKLPWQSDVDVAKKPGTCTHTAEVAFDVQLAKKGWEDRVDRTYLVNNSATQENKDLDQACTISPVTVDTLFETAIAEGLACLELPLGTRVSPRGHVLAHRKSKEGESHLYQVSLGLDQGVDPGEKLDFRRVSHSQSPDGNDIRSERVIATGVASTQITAQDTWVAVNLQDVDGEILEGDLVRRVFTKSLLNNLTGPDCEKILAER